MINEQQEEGLEIERVFIIPADFFNENGFKERFLNEVTAIRVIIRSEDREDVKSKINFLFTACQNNLNSPLKEEASILLLDLLTDYAQIYGSEETFQNIINFFEADNNKDVYFKTFSFLAKKIYALSYLQLYNIHHVKLPNDVSEKSIIWLLKSKYILLSMYNDYIENKIKLSDLDLGACLELLSSCLVQLSQWFESLYYIRLIEKRKIISANGPYMKVHTLDVITQKTCMILNPLLFLKVVDSAQFVIKSKRAIPEQKKQMIKYEKDYRLKIKNENITLLSLRKHAKKARQSNKKLKHYDKFIYDQNLFLNEHSYFCECDDSVKDNIAIETNHPHTKNAIGKENEKIIDLLKSEFIVARKAFYNSLFPQYNKSLSALNDENVKYAHIKNSFKNCYSILDVISNCILKILNLHVDEKQKRNIYFTSIWGKYIKEEHFKEHFYLISLYSIAKDLDDTEYSALKTYKKIRNAFEHKITYIIEGESTPSDTEYEQYFIYNDLVKKTELLLMLTKSAIISFIYFVRRETKRIEKKED